MKIGPFVRKLAGPYEPWLADVYRSFFVNLPTLAESISNGIPKPIAEAPIITEIGCGEGAFMEAILPRLPQWRAVGVDLCHSPGRLYRGDRSRVDFFKIDAEAHALTATQKSSLILLIDVLHHVPEHQQAGIWRSINLLADSNTTLVIKEWIYLNHPVCWFNYLCERYITGDRVNYKTPHEWQSVFARNLPDWNIFREETTKPWTCNHTFFLKRRE